ncbi:MAG: Fe-S cluster assembly protein HesB, partial [Pseudonocardia sp.]|nr:Fe-S cluster assembly protein HesB [Pseudonocardia sp.]
GRVQALAAAVVERYDGDVTALWTDAATGTELMRRLGALPGFGTQKAQIFTALLGKQRGVTPPGWREAAGSYGDDGAHRSVADVIDPESLLKVREFKQAAKAAAKAAANSTAKG